MKKVFLEAIICSTLKRSGQFGHKTFFDPFQNLSLDLKYR